MKYSVCFVAAMAAAANTVPALGQVPGGPGDLASHVDIGVDPSTGQLATGFTGIDAGTPIVLDLFQPSIPGGGGGFVNVLFSAEQDIAFRTASASVATDFGFDSFGQFGEGVPQIIAEAVEFDPLFRSFVFPSSFVAEAGDSLTLNSAGNGIDFHPFYFVASDDPGYIGRVEATWRFVPTTSTDIFSASDPFELIFVVGGDFDDDSRLTGDDETLLRAAIDGGSTETQFDLNRDMIVDDDDLAFWFNVLLEQPITLAGDYNGNGVVDAADYTVWQDNFGSMTSLDADGNGNGVVDAADYTVWQDNFGATSAFDQGLVAIPEPTTAGLLALLGSLTMIRRRKA